ncbi:MAG: peptidoglycan-binding protein [Novosphingobium sp.]|nr:peptidoglycan-binding protein [Novosphingobium sp.]
MTSISGMERDTMMAYRAEQDWDSVNESRSSMRQSVTGTLSRMNWRRTSLLLAFCTWGVIGYNALYAQPGPHPAPFFFGETASAPNAPAQAHVTRAEPTDPAGPLRTQSGQDLQGMIDEVALVRQVQNALYQRGYEVGEVDGLMGPMTRTAISAFERDMGLAQTGVLSPELLTRLGLDAQPAKQSAAPAQSPAVAVVQPSQPSEIGRMLEQNAKPAPVTSVRTVSTTTVRIDDLIAGAAPGGADPSLVPTPSMPVGDPVVAQVQSILAELGYAPGKIDGFVGPGTRNAITRFRADRGLAPGDGLSADLMAELASVSGITITR